MSPGAETDVEMLSLVGVNAEGVVVKDAKERLITGVPEVAVLEDVTVVVVVAAGGLLPAFNVVVI